MIRSAQAGDAPAIAAIWNPIVRDTVVTFWPTERGPCEIAGMIAARQSQGHAFLVAEGTDGITGFATTTQFRGGAGYARSLEHTVHVAPHCRGRGLGRMLMAAVQDHSRQGGARNLIGGVTASNGESLAFHARLGFAEWGRIPNAGWKFGRFHDLVFVGKDLTGG